MTKTSPHVPAHIYSDILYPAPVRFIGKIPVLEDELGEYVLLMVKIYCRKSKTTSELQVKCDADINIMRNLLETTLVDMAVKPKKNMDWRVASMASYVVYRINNRCAQPGENSLPTHLFGVEFHMARRHTEDPRDLRSLCYKKIQKSLA